jgi:predicted glycoside hydrolase/deacetylase ChbG (UPF0249 family)
VPAVVVERQQRIAKYLNASKVNQVLYNPVLTQSFDYVFKSQLEEFGRLFGGTPGHFDGHRHMHLCANMLLACPIPRGQAVRRSFSFARGEKSLVNRAYRKCIDRRLASRYRLTKHFFALAQRTDMERFARVCELARMNSVELMTHAYVPTEERFLMSDEYARALQGVPRGSYLDL